MRKQSMMNILVTGGTGFIGSALTRNLIATGHRVTVLSRFPEKVPRICGQEVKALADLNTLGSEDRFDVVINLAGAPIFGARWTKARKKILRASRVGLTERLVERMATTMTVKPKVLISGSAVGYYGDQGDTVLTEQASAREDFGHRLCRDWERSALQAEQLGIRVCLIRTGPVLAHGGGILQRMVLPFRCGLGGRLGEGRQWLPWIHRRDWIKIAMTLMTETGMSGAYNATAPHPVTNETFARTLAACLKRPACLPVPAWLLKVMLGEMSELVLGSQRVVPERLLQQGFEFEYPDLEAALQQALTSN